MIIAEHASEKIAELERINIALNDECQKYYDRLQALKEENIILVAELNDAVKQLKKALS